MHYRGFFWKGKIVGVNFFPSGTHCCKIEFAATPYAVNNPDYCLST